MSEWEKQVKRTKNTDYIQYKIILLWDTIHIMWVFTNNNNKAKDENV